jgi:hypothetical protein
VLVSKFAVQLSVIEDQLDKYTEEQRIRYLLAKLTPALRDTIVKYYTILSTRRELVTLVSRIESTEKS